MKIKFAVLKYYSGTIDRSIAPESMNVGILFVNTETETQEFIMTEKFKRVETFDDELNINMFKLTLRSIKKQVEESKKFSIETYVKKFVNSYQFSEIISSETDDYEEFRFTTKAMFLKYDIEKNKRLNRDSQIKYMKNLIKQSPISFASGDIKGRYGETLSFDMSFNNYYVKIFSFRDKDIKRMISNTKTWVLNANDLKESNGIKTIFVYDDNINNESFDIIMRIFKENNCEIYNIFEFKKFLEKNVSIPKQLDF